MILWSIHTLWYKGSAENKENDKFQTRGLFLKSNSPGWKADLSHKVKTIIRLTIHKCTVNVIPVTNPTQYTKLAKSIVKTDIRLLLGISISRIFERIHPISPYDSLKNICCAP